jgi:hypothetical protein
MEQAAFAAGERERRRATQTWQASRRSVGRPERRARDPSSSLACRVLAACVRSVRLPTARLPRSGSPRSDYLRYFAPNGTKRFKNTLGIHRLSIHSQRADLGKTM